MCPYTLDHNKMLASTMQHSTHNHTPSPPLPTTPTTKALEEPDRTAARKDTRCLLRTQQRVEPQALAAQCVPPSAPTSTSKLQDPEAIMETNQ